MTAEGGAGGWRRQGARGDKRWRVEESQSINQSINQH